jgi:hypothetical protein
VGGWPLDAEQTHQSLALYLLAEVKELLEAIELNDLGHLVLSARLPLPAGRGAAGAGALLGRRRGRRPGGC